MKVIFTLVILTLTVSVNAARIPADSLPGIKVPNAPSYNPGKPVVARVSIRLTCLASRRVGPSPLLVIDGIVEEYSRLEELKPDDIQSIYILKDVAATTIYGCMAARGVIVVTTRSYTDVKFVIKDKADSSIITGTILSFISKDKWINTSAKKADVVTTVRLRRDREYHMSVSSAGYKTLERPFKINSDVTQVIFLERDIQADNKKMALASVYPNPVQRGQTATVELESKADEPLQLQVFGMNGKMVSSQMQRSAKGLNRFAINVDTRWAAGFYILQLKNEKGIVVKNEKLVIQ